MNEKINKTEVGNISNYYGGLWIAENEEDGQCYWGIQDYSGIDWKPICSKLHYALKTLAPEN